MGVPKQTKTRLTQAATSNGSTEEEAERRRERDGKKRTGIKAEAGKKGRKGGKRNERRG